MKPMNEKKFAEGTFAKEDKEYVDKEAQKKKIFDALTKSHMEFFSAFTIDTLLYKGYYVSRHGEMGKVAMDKLRKSRAKKKVAKKMHQKQRRALKGK